MSFIKELYKEISDMFNNFVNTVNEMKEKSKLIFVSFCLMFLGIAIIFGCFLYIFSPLIVAFIFHPLSPSPNIHPDLKIPVQNFFILGVFFLGTSIVILMIKMGPRGYQSPIKRKNDFLTVKDKVFIVHGHDKNLRNEVELFLTKIKIDPIILEDEPNRGTQWIYDKLQENSDVKYAIVLYTPDDIGKEKNEENFEPRVRQNVILELGIFLEKLGNNRVCILYKDFPKLPSDIEGILRLNYDEYGGWKFPLMQDLKLANVRFNF
jgi:hypothetical protein